MFRQHRFTLLLVFASLSVYPAFANTYTVTNTNDNGTGSFRKAIENANNNPGTDTIAFAIPGTNRTIAPVTPLTPIYDPVIIDGTTQTGYENAPLIELNGSLLTENGHGLVLFAGDSAIKALVIRNFSQSGIHIDGAGGNVIAGCYIGTNITGKTAAPNKVGISIFQSSENLIGGTDTLDRNVISANTLAGISITEDNDGTALDNRIQGNYIGVDATGKAALGNGTGIYLYEAENTVIGGDEETQRNVVSGNTGANVSIAGGNALSNQVTNNTIGLGADGVTYFALSSYGVYLEGACDTGISNNSIAGILGTAIGIYDEADSTYVSNNAIGADANFDAIGNGNRGLDLDDGSVNSVIAYNLFTGNVGAAISLGRSKNTDILSNHIFGGGSHGLVLGEKAAEAYVESNLINGVGGDGVLVNASYATLQFNTITNNLSGNGIHFAVDSLPVTNNLIYGNILYGHSGDGVFLEGNASVGMRYNNLIANSIHDNVGKAIRLTNGANDNPVAPVITKAVLYKHDLSVRVTLVGRPNTIYIVDTFTNPYQANGDYEARYPSAIHYYITTDVNGIADAKILLAPFEAATVGSLLTVTATDLNGNTSELSAPVEIKDRAKTGMWVGVRQGTISKPISLLARLRNWTDVPPTSIAGKILTFKIGDLELGTGMTDADGYASLNRILPTNLSGGAQTLTVVFAGDHEYKPSTRTQTITIHKADVTLWVGDRSGRAGQSRTFRVRLRNRSASYPWPPVVGRTITLKVGSHILGSGTTGADGYAAITAAIPVGLPPGDNPLTAVFDGDHAYNPGAGTGVLTVLP